MSDMLAYQSTPRSTLNRLKNRGTYDQATIHNIIDSAVVLQVAFSPESADEDPFPTILPMLGCMGTFNPPNTTIETPAPVLYLHGHIASRLMKTPSSKHAQDHDEWPGFPVCVSATHLDGLVLAYTPFNHSCNYRSAVIHGWANLVTDPAEKMYALEIITNNVVAERWDNSRVPPTEAEMKSTGVLRVEIVSASAKARAATSGNDRVDLDNVAMREKVWTGVVPSWVVYGEPIPSPDNRVQDVPKQLREWIDAENKGREKYAIVVASQTPLKK